MIGLKRPNIEPRRKQNSKQKKNSDLDREIDYNVSIAISFCECISLILSVYVYLVLVFFYRLFVRVRVCVCDMYIMKCKYLNVSHCIPITSDRNIYSNEKKREHQWYWWPRIQIQIRSIQHCVNKTESTIVNSIANRFFDKPPKSWVNNRDFATKRIFRPSSSSNSSSYTTNEKSGCH